MNNPEILALINSIEIMESSSDGESMEYITVEDNIENREKLLKIITNHEIEENCFEAGEIDLMGIGFKFANWFQSGKGFFDKEEKGVLFNEKQEFKCEGGCCENCHKEQCPHNLTRCQ